MKTRFFALFLTVCMLFSCAVACADSSISSDAGIVNLGDSVEQVVEVLGEPLVRASSDTDDENMVFLLYNTSVSSSSEYFNGYNVYVVYAFDETGLFTAGYMPMDVETASVVANASQTTIEDSGSKESIAEETTITSSLKNLVIYNQNGIKMYFTGEYEDKLQPWSDDYFHLTLVVENSTSEELDIDYFGAINGWSFGSQSNLHSLGSVKANSKAKLDLWFTSANVSDISSCRDIESMDLTFRIKDTRGGILMADTGLINLKWD